MRVATIIGVLLAWSLHGAALGQNAPARTADTVPDTMQARVQACAACHGSHGQGTEDVYFPRLAGKPAGYLYHQLIAFRDGRRKYPPMNYLLAYLPDAYLMKMAEHYAAEKQPYPTPMTPVVSQEILNRGQTLVTQGDPSKDIPACVACHGPNLSGREPGIPGLIGLRPDYISAQLGAWRYGTRTALAPDCMQLIAARLTERDVAGVAAWLSSMPIPANTAPLPRSSDRLPLACGSQQPRRGE